MINLKPFPAFWTFNYNYWSGGIREDLFNLTWCQQPLAATEKNIDLNSSQPVLGANCMKMKITEQNKTQPRDLSWAYKNCSWRFLPACRVRS